MRKIIGLFFMFHILYLRQVHVFDFEEMFRPKIIPRGIIKVDKGANNRSS